MTSLQLATASSKIIRITANVIQLEIFTDLRLPERDRQCVQGSEIIHRSVTNYDYYPFLLHALELQRTIRTKKTFLDLLRLVIIASVCHFPCRTFVAQSINTMKT